MKKTNLLTIMFFLLAAIALRAQDDIIFHRLNSDNGLPCDETYTVIQDDEGFIWIGTLYGIYRYDGYQVRNIAKGTELGYKEIKCLADDHHGGIWVGTKEGLYHIDKRTFVFQTYHLTDFPNSDIINCFLCSDKNGTWVGTDGGLYLYDSDADSLGLKYNENKGSMVPHCAVKSVVEDKNGYLWVGTWDQGLYRYNTKSREWYKMPKFNDSNSAHVVFPDGKSLWVGTWGRGLYCIRNPYDTNSPLDKKCFINTAVNQDTDNIIGNYIYSIDQNKEDKALWIGTNSGLSVLSLTGDQPAAFRNYPSSSDSEHSYLATGVESVFSDHTGLMWMCTTENGVVSARKNKSLFKCMDYSRLIGFSKENIPNSITTAQDGTVLVGVKSVGTAQIRIDTSDGHSEAAVVTESLTGRTRTSNDRCLFVMEDGSVATGTVSDGFFLRKADGNVHNYQIGNTSWMRDNCVLSFSEDNSVLLVGTWKGLCALHPDGSGLNVSELTGNEDFMNSQINSIIKISNTDYWMSTSNRGFIHVYGNLSGGEKDMKRLHIRFHEGYHRLVKILQGSDGTIWACSRDDGLIRYNPDSDTFERMNQAYSLPTNILSDLEEDQQGDLWMTTNIGLIRLTFDKTRGTDRKEDIPRVRLFTKSDGLPSNYLGRAYIASLPNGDMCMALTDYITMFTPSQIDSKTEANEAVVTDLKIFSESTTDLSDNAITLSHNQNDLTFEFSTLTYDELPSIRFAYRLEGYDHNWVYAPIGHFSAYYNNLPPGSYTFRLQSTDASGVWTESSQQIRVTILQPIYRRWWALLLYALAVAILGWYLWRHYQNLRCQREEVRLAHLQAEQTEELNHKKLQFFTNISHDLMTPLTIISASVDSMDPSSEVMVSEMKPVIKTNVTKLTRMIQQILQFRKVESGNMNLRVSRRDIVSFCRKEVESIAPLMRSKDIQLTFESNVNEYLCWFDSDALDKIVYNLLSNAAKYSNEKDAKVVLNLHCGKTATIRVSDNGQGIPEDRRKDLFKRFYEGEHRKFNTYGTGIGLSLARDLALLHHGSIDFESEEGKGTTFIVNIPTTEGAFSMEERDESLNEEDGWHKTASDGSDNDLAHQLEEEQTSATGTSDGDFEERLPNILLVEDNMELLSVIQRILSEKYNVVTAGNGREALDCMRNANNDIQMIISDVMMPEMDGLELTHLIKSDIEISHIPVLLLTAKRTDEDKTEAYRIGADAYLTKPFSMELLLARIENILRRRKQTARQIDKSINQSLLSDKLALKLETDLLNITDIDADFISRCKTLVEDHIDDPEFGQAQFAKEMCVSKSTLYKKLKSLTGMNTPMFVRSIRMNTACFILQKNPTVRVSDLAYSVGYNDPKYFSQCFKKDFGMLPSEYAISSQAPSDTDAHQPPTEA